MNNMRKIKIRHFKNILKEQINKQNRVKKDNN